MLTGVGLVQFKCCHCVVVLWDCPPPFSASLLVVCVFFELVCCLVGWLVSLVVFPLFVRFLVCVFVRQRVCVCLCVDKTAKHQTGPKLPTNQACCLDVPLYGVARQRSVLALHDGRSIVDTCLGTESKYGLHPNDLRWRFAVHVGDGAVEGPFGQSFGEMYAAACGLPPSRGWGALDDFHAAEKAGSHADYTERGPQGYVHMFHDIARKLRSLFRYGVGQIIARAAAKKYGLQWRRPPAPYSQAPQNSIKLHNQANNQPKQLTNQANNQPNQPTNPQDNLFDKQRPAASSSKTFQ